MEKRAALTTKQIVILIILIISFLIILFLIFRLNLGETTDKQVCHNSVVLRGTAAIPGKVTALNCKTNYVCITAGGSECAEEGMPNPTVVKKVNSKEEVYQIFTDEMADCWWMFGEGKVDYLGEITLFEKTYCSICSQIAFDGSVKEFFKGGFSQKEIYEEIVKKEIPGKKITYAEYFYGEKISSTQDILTKTRSNSFSEIDLDKQHFILMGAHSERSKWLWRAILGAGMFVSIPLVLGALVVGAVVDKGEFIGFIVKGEKTKIMPPSILEVNSGKFKGLNCYDVKTL